MWWSTDDVKGVGSIKQEATCESRDDVAGMESFPQVTVPESTDDAACIGSIALTMEDDNVSHILQESLF